MNNTKTTDSHPADLLPNRRLGSGLEIAVLYSLCKIKEKQEDFEKSDIELSSDTIRYLNTETIDSELEKDEDDDDSRIIVINVDLSGENPRLDSEEPIENISLSEDLKYKLGFIPNPGKSGGAVDYSITNHIGSSKKELDDILGEDYFSRFLYGRFEKWPDMISEKNEIVQELSEISDNELTRAREYLLSKHEKESEVRGFVTVRVKLEPEGEYLWPAELPKLYNPAIENVKEKLRSGRSVPSPAYDEGISMITGEDSTVVGGSQGVFASYGKKQRSGFPDLRVEESWRQRPLSEDVAYLITVFNSDIEEKLSRTIRGLQTILLPYPNEKLTREVFDRFYENVYSKIIQGSDSDPHEFIQIVTSIVNDISEEDEREMGMKISSSSNYNLYTVLAEKEQNSVYNIFLEEPNSKVEYADEFSENYIKFLNHLEDSIFQSTISNLSGNHTLFDVENVSIRTKVLYGDFTTRLYYESQDSEDTSLDITSDDIHFDMLNSLLRGNPINGERLLGGFVKRIVSKTREMKGEEYVFDESLLLFQMSVLDALSKTVGVTHTNFKSLTFHMPNEMSQKPLQEFIEENSVFDGSPEAKSVFVLGGIVGNLSEYQRNSGVSTKMVEKYPVDSITKRSIEEVTASVIGKNEEYSAVEGYNMNREYLSVLNEEMLKKRASEWELTNTELQWLYSLGVSFGKEQFYSSNSDSENNGE